MEIKKRLREEILTKRKTLDLSERQEKSQVITEHLFGLDSVKQAKAIMLYVSFGSEVVTDKMIDGAQDMGKRIFVPDAVGTLETGKDLIKRGNPSEIDVVIVPGIAFDEYGNRIGYGSGWYDKFLHRLKADVHLIGVAFQCQIVDRVPNHPHDIRVHTIVTEDRVIDCSAEELKS